MEVEASIGGKAYRCRGRARKGWMERQERMEEDAGREGKEVGRDGDRGKHRRRDIQIWRENQEGMEREAGRDGGRGRQELKRDEEEEEKEEEE